MKNLLLGIASLMMIGIMFATVVYQTNTQISKPELEQLEEKIQKEAKVPQPDKLMPIYEDTSSGIGYSLQNDQLQITFDKGENWVTVPVEKESLFSGEYIGSKEELIQNSYILTKNRALFLNTNYKLQYVTSIDQGKTWQHYIITETYPFIRFRKIDFLNENFGYAIVSGDRTMSSEWSSIFLTIDGGTTWVETNRPNTTRLVADGGFVDEKAGFLSFGILNPEKPDLYVTQDGGNSWNQAQITIPVEYDKIFVIAETPFIEENKLAMLLNQGPNGDYQGGKVKGKFISTDNGLTWVFESEVEPSETKN